MLSGLTQRFNEPAPPLPTFTWTGFYAGFNAGADFDSYTNYGLYGNTAGTNAAIATGQRAGFLATNATGFAGGGQVGYNYELQNGLFGSSRLEALAVA